MNDLGKIHQLIIPVFGYNLTFNIETMIMTWVVITIWVIFGYFATRKMKVKPGYIQLVGELIVGFVFNLVVDTLGDRLGKKYGPLLCTLFMFLLLSNWLGLIPLFEEPTKDLNTPLSLGILCFLVAHYVGIKEMGLKRYVSEYFEPLFIWFPLNVLDELSRIVSISFRLYGNIMGGAIIIMVVSYLTYGILLPPFLNFFFGIFVGAVQAFVFTILATCYIAMKTK